MLRPITDVTIGVIAGLLVASLAGGAYAIAERGACYDAQVAASAWTSSNTDASISASIIPDCTSWENAMKVIVSVGFATLIGFAGLVVIRTRTGFAAEAAPR